MADKATTIMLADDHAVVRAGYRYLLESETDLAVIEEVSSGEEAIEAYQGLRPDVLIMDLSMPGMGGLEAIRRILAKHEGARILVFTMHENTAFVQQALQAGVKGYISKNSSPEVLVTAIRKLAAGDMYIDAELAQDMIKLQARREQSPFEELSMREFQILCMFAEARSPEEIAEELSLSAKTVSNYLTLIKEKLGVRSSPELIRLAIRNGLVTV